MDFAEALLRRKSCRSFESKQIPDPTLKTVLAAFLRAPTAGNTWSHSLIVLSGDETDRYWDVALPLANRESFPWPGLLRAPVLVIPTVRPEGYLDRYSESDKSAAGLGESLDAWTVPYWWVDSGGAVASMLLAAADAGLGSLLFGMFSQTAAVVERLGIPGDQKPVGVIALGYSDGGGRASQSQKRTRPTLEEIVHHGQW